MKFEEIKDFIRAKAPLHQAADEAFIYEEIELDVFQKILRFAITEGFEADSATVKKVLEPYNSAQDEEEESDEPDYTTGHYMDLLLEQMDATTERNELSPKTVELREFWLREFWGTADEA